MHLITWHGTVVAYDPVSGDLVQTAISADIDRLSLVSIELPSRSISDSTRSSHSTSVIISPTAEGVQLQTVSGTRRVHLIKDSRYLVAEKAGALVFDREEAQTWETFLLATGAELSAVVDILTVDIGNRESGLILPVHMHIADAFQLVIGGEAVNLEAFLDNGRQPSKPEADYSALTPAPGHLVDKLGLRPLPQSRTIYSILEVNSTLIQSAIRLFNTGDLYPALNLLKKTEAIYGSEADSDFLKVKIAERLEDAIFPFSGIVWRSRPFWERDWLSYLMPDVRAIHEEECYTEFRRETIIVVDNDIKPHRVDFFRKAFLSGRRIILFHLSDEEFLDDYSAYRWCHRIYRNYYSPLMCQGQQVSPFPLGYKSGFEGATLPKKSIDRKYLWSFAGDPNKSTRGEMLNAMRQVGNGFEHMTSGFDTDDALDVRVYSEVLRDSIFIPCPSGWVSLDSFRVYEALEAGSIPIVEQRSGLNYFKEAFGENPLPRLSTWGDAVKMVKSYVDGGELDSLTQRCFEWWSDYKWALKTRILSEATEYGYL